MVLELFLNAVVAGILLGGFYAAVALGLSITFGQLDIVNIAHPAFVIVGSYTTYIINESLGLDPILAGVLATPIFFGAGVLLYRFYYVSFERTGQESLSGLAFFFGIMFIIEVVLIMVYGVDYRLVEAPYIGKSFQIGVLGESALCPDIHVCSQFEFEVSVRGGLCLHASSRPAEVAGPRRVPERWKERT